MILINSEDYFLPSSALQYGIALNTYRTARTSSAGPHARNASDDKLKMKAILRYHKVKEGTNKKDILPIRAAGSADIRSIMNW